mgnify:CR=1 FL=1
MAFVHLHLHTEFSLLDGACRIKSSRNSSRKMTSAAVILKTAVFFKRCIIGMGRTHKIFGGFIIFAVLTLITNKNTQWSSCGIAVKKAADNFKFVRFLTLCGNFSFWFSFIQLCSYQIQIQLYARCQTVDIYTNGCPVRFAEQTDLNV